MYLGAPLPQEWVTKGKDRLKTLPLHKDTIRTKVCSALKCPDPNALDPLIDLLATTSLRTKCTNESACTQAWTTIHEAFKANVMGDLVGCQFAPTPDTNLAMHASEYATVFCPDVLRKLVSSHTTLKWEEAVKVVPWLDDPKNMLCSAKFSCTDLQNIVQSIDGPGNRSINSTERTITPDNDTSMAPVLAILLCCFGLLFVYICSTKSPSL